MRKHIRGAVDAHIVLLAEHVTRLENLVTTLSVCEFESHIQLHGDEESATSFFAVGIEWRLELKAAAGSLQIFLCNPHRVPCCVTFSVAIYASPTSTSSPTMRVNTIAKQKFPEENYWAWGWGNFCRASEIGNDLGVRVTIDRHF